MSTFNNFFGRHIIRYYLLFAPVLLFSQIGYSQNLQNLFFNSYSDIVRMNFSTGTPVISYTGISNGYEAIAHEEDGLGNVLFYVNANGVYRANGVLMPGSSGIFADPSSAEIDICPFVNNPDKFYIFYNSQTCSNLSYCIVDMTLAGGAGDVTNLNTLLNANDFSEGLEIVKRDCYSYWLIAYQCNAQFVKFLIDSNGIGSMQGIFNYPQPSGGYDGRGELDFHNGKMGIAFGFIPYAFVCDFDPIAGTISNPVTLNFTNADQFTGMYGLEFSPDASKAYITNWYNDQTDNIFQYDFITQNIQSWKSSNQASQQGGEDGPGQIELGKDSNLYVINNGVNEITVISNANSVTPTITHIQTTSILALGVSDFIQSDLFHNNTFSYQNYCFNDTIFFNATVYSCNGAAVNILWNFGDPASGTANTDTSLATYHLFTGSGFYTVTMIVYDSTFTDTVTQTINVFGVSPFNLGPDTLICNSSSYTIGATILGASYLWSTGATTSHITVTTPGTYYLKASLGPCFEIDTIVINFAPGPSVNLGADTTLCYVTAYTIDAGNPGMNYLWSNGSTDQVININSTGTYTVTVTNGICTQTDSILVNLFNPPPLFLGNDDVLCTGDSIIIGYPVTNASYLWNNGATTAQLTITSAGTYIQTVTIGSCTATDTLSLNFVPEPVINLGPDSLLCNTPSLILDAGSNPGYTYLWSTGETTYSIVANSTTTYTVTVNNGTCDRTDAISLTFAEVLPFSLGNDTTACQGTSVQFSSSATNVNFLWSTGDTTSSINVTNSGTYWLTTFVGSCSQGDTITISFIQQPLVDLGNDTVFCEGSIYQLDAGNPGASYQWSNGSTSQQIAVAQSGTYTVVVSVANCFDSDTAVVTVETKPAVDLGNDKYICSGIPVSLNAPGFLKCSGINRLPVSVV